MKVFKNTKTLKIENWKLEIKNQKLKIENWKLKIENWKLKLLSFIATNYFN